MVTEILEKPAPLFDHLDQQQSILVIDDDTVLAEILSRRLSQQGFATKTADSGAAGLALARSEHPDLILLDLRLPDTDGFSICEELADSSDTCNIPVIILTGMEQPDIIRRSRLAGCYYFVRKPYDPNALLVLIRQAIEEAEA